MTGTPSIEEEKATPEQVDYITAFRALSNKTSVDIIAILVADDAYVGDIVAKLGDVPQATVSKLLKQLKGAGLVTSTKEGVKRKYAIQWESFAELSDMLAGIAGTVSIRKEGFWNPELFPKLALNTTGGDMYESLTPEESAMLLAAFNTRETHPMTSGETVMWETAHRFDDNGELLSEAEFFMGSEPKQFAMKETECADKYLTHSADALVNGVQIGGVSVSSDGSAVFDEGVTIEPISGWTPSSELPVTKKRSFWDWLRS